MAHITATASFSAKGRGKRLQSWHISQGTGAQIVNFRHATAADDNTGAVVFQVQVPANTSASQAYPDPIYVPEGFYVEVVNTGLNYATIVV
jgi:hypothetical protein